MNSDFLNTIKENDGIIHKLVRIYTDQHDDQQDLYQEIIYQLWKSYNNFQGKSKVGTWIYKVALNTSLAYINLKKKHSRKIEIQNNTLQIEDKIDTLLEDRIDDMYQQIRKLNEIDRAIIFLFLEGKDYEEIASICGLTNSNIGTRLNRIRQKLKDQLIKE